MAPRAPVLVVDDDGASRDGLCRALGGARLPWVAVGSGAEALTWLEQNVPSLVLLDLALPPPVPGFEVLRTIRSRASLADVPVVVLATPEADHEIMHAFEAGADDFVRMPVRAAELVARIRGQLRLRRYVQTIAQRERDAQIVLELTQALSSSLDIREILFSVVRRLAEVARVERVSIVLARDHGDVGYVVAASDDQHLRDLPIDLTKYPEIREVLASGRPLVVADATTHPLLEVVRHDIRGGFTSLAILPILFEERPMGVIFLRARHEIAFDEERLALFRTIANATAIALRNARILQSLRDQTQQITFARFEAERRLRTLERYADFFESAADGICVIDSDGQLLFSNMRARQITGYSEATLAGKKLGDLLSPAERARAHEIRLGFARGVFPRGVDFTMLCNDGREIVIDVNFNSVLREDNAVVFTFRDVTEERATQAELRKTKAFLERVIDSSVDAIVSTDLRGTVLLFNGAAERCYGHRSADVIGKMNASELYPEGVAREVMKRIRGAELGGPGRLEDFRCDVLAKDGTTVPVSLSAGLIYDQDGEPIGSVGIFTDLRERLRMEERLAAAQEELQARERQAIVAELAGAAAHELNQPLTSVSAYAELLKRKLEKDTSAYSAAEVIATEAERMAEIVRKIGKITKYETKSYVGQAKILDLDKASGEAPPSRPSRRP